MHCNETKSERANFQALLSRDGEGREFFLSLSLCLSRFNSIVHGRRTEQIQCCEVFSYSENWIHWLDGWCFDWLLVSFLLKEDTVTVSSMKANYSCLLRDPEEYQPARYCRVSEPIMIDQLLSLLPMTTFHRDRRRHSLLPDGKIRRSEGRVRILIRSSLWVGSKTEDPIDQIVEQTNHQMSKLDGELSSDSSTLYFSHQPSSGFAPAYDNE